MKTKVIITEYMMQEVGEIVYDVIDKETYDALAFDFNSYEEAEAWVRTQKDLTL